MLVGEHFRDACRRAPWTARHLARRWDAPPSGTGAFAVEGAAYAGRRGRAGRRPWACCRTRSSSCSPLTSSTGTKRVTTSWTSSSTCGDSSLFNGDAAGFVLAFIAVVLTSVRIARMQYHCRYPGPRPGPTVGRGGGLPLCRLSRRFFWQRSSVPVCCSSAGAAGSYPAPCADSRRRDSVAAYRHSVRGLLTGVSVRRSRLGPYGSPRPSALFDDGSTADYVVMGTSSRLRRSCCSACHQRVVLRPRGAPSQPPPERTGWLHVWRCAYPIARPFRTGATLGVICIVVLVIVLLAQISALISAGVSTAVRDAAAGWTLRGRLQLGHAAS